MNDLLPRHKMSPAESGSVNVRPLQLLVRCFAEQKDGQWQAFSVEFGLAAQADSLSEVKTKLDGMIQSYLEDALVGQDRAHARTLLARKGPFSVTAKYYLFDWLSRRPKFNEKIRPRNVFGCSMCLAPASC